MLKRFALVLVCAMLAVRPASADNAMGYRLMSMDEAARLPAGHGALGMEAERSRRITDSGMTFEIIRVKAVRSGSAAAAAGLRTGDQIIAVNGMVFQNLATFGNYVGSLTAGSRATIDFIPSGRGPEAAQRISVVIADPARPSQAGSAGMSTGEKLAIGAGAAALLGCYEVGCFSHHGRAPEPAPPPR